MTKYLCLSLCLWKCEHYLIYTTDVVFNNKEEKMEATKKEYSVNEQNFGRRKGQ